MGGWVKLAIFGISTSFWSLGSSFSLEVSVIARLYADLIVRAFIEYRLSTGDTRHRDCHGRGKDRWIIGGCYLARPEGSELQRNCGALANRRTPADQFGKLLGFPAD